MPAESHDATPEPLEDTARIARDLIRFETVNFGGGRSLGETEAAEYVAAELEALGLQPRLFESAERRTSVVARVPGRDPQRPPMVLHGHLDVVPAVAADWSVDPFAGEIRDGMLWGRGAVDMKDMDAMILTSLRDILGAGELPARELIVAFFADEENGGVFGSHWMVDEHPELFADATEAVSEVGGYSIDLNGTRAYLLQTGEKALTWIRLVAHGVAAHGSRVIRDNAVTRLATADFGMGEDATLLLGVVEVRSSQVVFGCRLESGTPACFVVRGLTSSRDVAVLPGGTLGLRSGDETVLRAW